MAEGRDRAQRVQERNAELLCSPAKLQKARRVCTATHTKADQLLKRKREQRKSIRIAKARAHATAIQHRASPEPKPASNARTEQTNLDAEEADLQPMLELQAAVGVGKLEPEIFPRQ